jgi:hypothetical protein
MRPLLAILLAIGMSVTSLAPPVAQAQEFGGGVVLGANVATLRGGGDDLGYRTAASGGLYARVGIPGPLAVRTELLFSQKGAKLNTQNGELTLKANYLELPVLVVGQLPFARSYNPHLLAGPALSLKLYERQGAPGFSINTEDTLFERTDVGVMVGGGASLGGPGALQVEVRYILGMRDVTQTVTTAPLDEALPTDGTNGVWSIVARFGI